MAISRRRPTERKTADWQLGAGQQEQDHGEPQQHGKNLVEISVDAEGRTPKRVERNLVRTIPVILREPLGDSPHEQVQFGLRLILRDTRAKLSEHVQPENAAIIGTVKTPNITIHRDMNPQFGAKAGRSAREIRRATPKRCRMAIDLNRFADDLRITREMVLPDGVTDDYHCSAGAQRSSSGRKARPRIGGRREHQNN